MLEEVLIANIKENKEVYAKLLLEDKKVVILSDVLKTVVFKNGKGFEHDIFYKEASWVKERDSFDINSYVTGGVTYMGDNLDAINNSLRETEEMIKKVNFYKNVINCDINF